MITEANDIKMLKDEIFGIRKIEDKDHYIDYEPEDKLKPSRYEGPVEEVKVQSMALKEARENALEREPDSDGKEAGEESSPALGRRRSRLPVELRG